MYTGYTESRPRRKAIRSYLEEAGGDTDKVLTFFLAFIVLLAFPFQAASGQKKSDIGILGGTSYYLGDVNPFRHFYSPSPAGGLIFRYNFNPRNSIRFHGMYVRIKGDPADFPELNNNTFDPRPFPSGAGSNTM
jgi:hypothetical protein